MTGTFENQETKKDFLQAKNEIVGLQEKVASEAGLGYNSMIFKICRKDCTTQKEQFVEDVVKLFENYRWNLEISKEENKGNNEEYQATDIILSCISFIYVYVSSSNTMLVNSGNFFENNFQELNF